MTVLPPLSPQYTCETEPQLLCMHVCCAWMQRPEAAAAGQAQMAAQVTLLKVPEAAAAHAQVGAQVMLLKNLELGGERMLVNGSRGVITNMMSKKARLPAASERSAAFSSRLKATAALAATAGKVHLLGFASVLAPRCAGQLSTLRPITDCVTMPCLPAGFVSVTQEF